MTFDQVLRKRGQGFGILVSKIPKETEATYSLQEPPEASLHNYPLLRRSNNLFINHFTYIFCFVYRLCSFCNV